MNNEQTPLRMYVDIDGVLSDLTLALVRHLGREDLLENWPEGQYSYKDVFGLEDLSSIPYEVFKDIPLTRECPILLSFRAFFDVSFITRLDLTSMGHVMQAAIFATSFNGIPTIFAPNCLKAEVVPEEIQLTTLLIDDCDAELDAWAGPGILMPRPWNSARNKEPYDALAEALTRMSRTQVTLLGAIRSLDFSTQLNDFFATTILAGFAQKEARRQEDLEALQHETETEGLSLPTVDEMCHVVDGEDSSTPTDVPDLVDSGSLPQDDRGKIGTDETLPADGMVSGSGA